MHKVNKSDVRKTKVLAIEWVDSTGQAGWAYSESADDFAAAHIWSVGYLCFETAKAITISTSVSGGSGGVMAPLTIPKCAIVKRKTLNVR